jgi:cytoskeletal protein CcmA (bactofilin family)
MFLRRIQSDERGSALMAVIAIAGIAGIVALVVGTVSVNALVITDVTRTSVQSQAAAEAGLAATLASLRANGCAPGVDHDSKTVAPFYSVRVSVSSTDSRSSAFAPGCPSATGYLRIQSTGADTASGLNDPEARVHLVEGIYYTTVTTAGVTGTGPAVYTYSGTGVSGSGKLLPVNGSQPSVQIKQGDFKCTGAGSADADIVVANGTFEASGSCKTRNVWSSGSTSVSGGTVINGNVVSSSFNIASGQITGSIWSSGKTKISGSPTIGGSVVTSGLEFVNGRIGGSAWSNAAMDLNWGSEIMGGATAVTLGLNGGKVAGDAWATGTANFPAYASTIGGHLTAKAVSGAGVAGTGKTVVPAGPGPGPAAPTPTKAPIVPDWVDFTYNLADWPGFVEKEIGASCDFTALRTAAASLGASKGIVDARRCTNGIVLTSGDDKLSLANDLVILAKSFSLTGGGAFTTTSPRKLWLITPDTTPDRIPTCLSGGHFTVNGGFTQDPRIAAMIYTPCRTTISRAVVGQVYAGGISVDADAPLSYVAVGLPLVDLRTGEPAVVSGPSTIGEPYSVRDYAGE